MSLPFNGDKKKRPDIKIVVGGPEVSTDTDYILHHPAIDIGCFGEGEKPFVEILKSICYGQPDLSEIKGIFFRYNNETHIDSTINHSENLDLLPSPFQLGFIDVKGYPVVSYESSRGCPFNCTYCYTASLPFRLFPLHRVIADMELLLKNGVKKVRFIDSSIILRSDFEIMAEKLALINYKREMAFSGFCYAEHLTEKKVRLLKECNFVFLETGLQTIHPKTLNLIRRMKFHPEKFIEGIRLLEKYGLNYSVDTIVGLPEESYNDFEATIKFLKDHKVIRIGAFPLMVLPGTELSGMTKQFGINYHQTAPYYVIETSTINPKEIRKSARFQSQPLEKASEKAMFFSSFDGRVCNIPLLVAPENGDVELFKNAQKIIVDMDGFHRLDLGRTFFHNLCERRLGVPTTLWFKCRNNKRDFPSIRDFVDRVTKANPFMVITVILELSEVPAVPVIDSLINTWHISDIRVENLRDGKITLKTILLIPWQASVELMSTWGDRCQEKDIVWVCDCADMTSLKQAIETLRSVPKKKRVLIDINSGWSLEDINNAFEYLNDNTNFEFRFRNIALYYAHECVKTKYNTINPNPKPMYEQIYLETTVRIDSLGLMSRDLKPCADNDLKMIIFQKKIESI